MKLTPTYLSDTKNPQKPSRQEESEWMEFNPAAHSKARGQHEWRATCAWIALALLTSLVLGLVGTLEVCSGERGKFVIAWSPSTLSQYTHIGRPIRHICN